MPEKVSKLTTTGNLEKCYQAGPVNFHILSGS